MCYHYLVKIDTIGRVEEMKKVLATTISVVLLSGVLSPMASATDTNKAVSNKETYGSLEVSQAEVKQVGEIVDIINELDQNLNMYDISKNKQGEIDNLSPEAQEFYYSYKQELDANNGDLNKKQTVGFLQSYYANNSNLNVAKEQSRISFYNPIKYKEYKLSNQQVVDIVGLVGLHGTGWGLLAALAKKFGKSPTFLTAMLIAVPALGAAALAKCNRKSKGVIIMDYQVGATHSFSCKSR